MNPQSQQGNIRELYTSLGIELRSVNVSVLYPFVSDNGVTQQQRPAFSGGLACICHSVGVGRSALFGVHAQVSFDKKDQMK